MTYPVLKGAKSTAAFCMNASLRVNHSQIRTLRLPFIRTNSLMPNPTAITSLGKLLSRMSSL